MFIRYEDLSQEPLEMASKVYSFIGKKLPESIAKWIKESQAPATTPIPEPIHSTDKHLKKPKIDPYSTKRNSTYTMMKWRFENDFHTINNVQKLCPNALSLGGYNIMKSEVDLTNLNISAIETNPFDKG